MLQNTAMSVKYNRTQWKHFQFRNGVPHKLSLLQFDRALRGKGGYTIVKNSKGEDCIEMDDPETSAKIDTFGTTSQKSSTPKAASKALATAAARAGVARGQKRFWKKTPPLSQAAVGDTCATQSSTLDSNDSDDDVEDENGKDEGEEGEKEDGNFEPDAEVSDSEKPAPAKSN